MSFHNPVCWLFALILIAVMLFGCLLCASRERPRLGIFNGRLGPCPDRPNCICSECETNGSYIEPLAFTSDTENAWNNARAAVQDIGGNIQKETDGYLWATFTSRVFRFVDDLELRMDITNRIIHMRSASRVGYSDLGANKKRVQKLRSRFIEKQNELSDHLQ